MGVRGRGRADGHARIGAHAGQRGSRGAPGPLGRSGERSAASRTRATCTRVRTPTPASARPQTNTPRTPARRRSTRLQSHVTPQPRRRVRACCCLAARQSLCRCSTVTCCPLRPSDFCAKLRPASHPSLSRRWKCHTETRRPFRSRSACRLWTDCCTVACQHTGALRPWSHTWCSWAGARGG